MRVPRAHGVQVPAAQGAPASSCRGTRTWGQRRDAGAWTSRAEALSFAGRSYLPAVLSCAELADPARSLRHNQRRRDPDAPTRDRRPASTSSPPDVELGRPRRRTGGTGRIGTPKPWCEMLALILVAAVASDRSASPGQLGGRRRRRRPESMLLDSVLLDSVLLDSVLRSGPRLVAQHELLDLAGGGLRQLPESHRLRGLEPRQPGLDVLDDLRLGRRSAPACRVTYAAGTSPHARRAPR